MYPNLYYAFKDLFGINLPALRFINSFGFFVAIAFLVAAALLGRELRRKSKAGLLSPTEEEVLVGEPARPVDLLINFVLGFILGYKILALFFLSSDATQDPQTFIFSGMGNWPLGIALGLVFAGLKWWEKRKQQLPKPEKRKIRIWPQDRVGEITVLALIFGLVGAKLFDIFENWSSFLQKPSDYLLSPAGLTFYGGLICAGIAIIVYSRKHKISIRHLADAIAPSLMIAYAIGRMGCHVAGDGDWGIYNSAYKVDATTNVVAATPKDFTDTVNAHGSYFVRRFEDIRKVPHASFKNPGFLPDWMVAYTYPNNVNEDGIPIAGCTDSKFCNRLPIPVFPTSVYEIIVGTLFFLILWGLRKRLRPYGALFCLYLILNGLERFFIEKIRVNEKLDFLGSFGIYPTQAELIAVGLIITGIIGWIILKRKYNDPPATIAE
jgi:phosphatidylglycerol---prolipoprotein diacylglyceryl transferase